MSMEAGYPRSGSRSGSGDKIGIGIEIRGQGVRDRRTCSLPRQRERNGLVDARAEVPLKRDKKRRAPKLGASVIQSASAPLAAFSTETVEVVISRLLRRSIKRADCTYHVIFQISELFPFLFNDGIIC